MSWVAAGIAAAAALYGAHRQRKAQKNADQRNEDFQKKMARESIQMRVRDARRAGIAPEFALGAPGVNVTPTATADQGGSIIADAGQNISRAALAESTQPDRDLTKQLQMETLRGMKIENDLKVTQGLSKTSFPQNPAFPHPNGNVIPGQGNSPVKDVPLERTGMSSTAPYSEGGSIPSVGWAKTPDGGLRPVPSTDVKNRIEDQVIPETAWAAQHMVAPNFSKNPTAKPPVDALPKGSVDWRWSVSRQAWYPVTHKASKSEAEFYKEKFRREYKSKYKDHNTYDGLTY